MRHHVFLSAAFLSLLWAGGGRAEVKDPAELVPASVLFYAELRQPGAIAREIAGLFEGSVLANLADSPAGPQAGPPGHGPDRLARARAVAAMLLSPELAGELQRMQGAAVAVTGIGARGEPEFVAIVLPGESNVPGFVMRMFLAVGQGSSFRSDGRETVEVSRSARPVGEVEGVKLYRQVERTITTVAGNPQAREETRETGPVFALMSDALLIGSPGAVKDAIHRAKGKDEQAALAAAEGFREAARELGAGPGLFFYANAEAGLKIAERRAGAGKGDVARAVLEVVNGKAVQAVAGRWAIDKATGQLRLLVRLNPDEKTPLLDILPAKAFRTDVLHFAPSGAWVAAGISNADGEQRWTRLVELADRLSKAAGKEEGVAQQVEQVETALDLKLGKDVFGRITDVAFTLANPFPGPGAQPVRGEPPLAFIVRAADEDAAKTLLSHVVPKVGAMLMGQGGKAEPEEKTVGDHTIYTVGPVHYGREGATLVLGPSPKVVADALAAGAKEGGLLADKKVATALDRVQGPVALVVSKPPPILLGMLVHKRAGTMAGPAVIIEGKPIPPPPPPDRPPPEAREQDDPPPPPSERPRPGLRGPGGPTGQERMAREFLQLADSADPFVLTVTRNPDRIFIEARQTGLKPLVAKVVTLLVEAASIEPVSSPPVPGVSPFPPIPTPTKKIEK